MKPKKFRISNHGHNLLNFYINVLASKEVVRQPKYSTRHHWIKESIKQIPSSHEQKHVSVSGMSQLEATASWPTLPV